MPHWGTLNRTALAPFKAPFGSELVDPCSLQRSGCGGDHAESTSAAVAFLPGQQADKQRWFHVLSRLQHGHLSPQALAATLSEALEAMRNDQNWSGSGGLAHLLKAMDACQRGDTQECLSSVTLLLDFHQLVERLRARQRAAEKGVSCAKRKALEDETAFPVPELPTRSSSGRQGLGHASMFHSSNHQLESPSCKRARQTKQPQQHLRCNASVPTAVTGPGAPAAVVKPSTCANPSWTGSIWHEVDGQQLQLCKVTVQLPDAELLDEFPGTDQLSVSYLIQRKGILLGQHLVCRCSIMPSESTEQARRLAHMAKYELVATINLQTCALILVPYFDNKGTTKMVSFMLAL